MGELILGELMLDVVIGEVRHNHAMMAFKPYHVDDRSGYSVTCWNEVVLGQTVAMITCSSDGVLLLTVMDWLLIEYHSLGGVGGFELCREDSLTKFDSCLGLLYEAWASTCWPSL